MLLYRHTEDVLFGCVYVCVCAVTVYSHFLCGSKQTKRDIREKLDDKIHTHTHKDKV